jgi:hypothetical protein
MECNVQTSSRSEIQIVSYNEIPSTSLPNDRQINNVGVFKFFHDHNQLNNFLPSNENIAFAWLQIKVGEELLLNYQDNKTIIIIYKGSAKLEKHEQILNPGDKLLIPENYKGKLTHISKDGLYAIELKFNKKNVQNNIKINPQEENKESNLSFEGLLAYNHFRLQQLLKNPFFLMLQDNTLTNIKKRQLFLDCMQVFSDFFQTMMISRQATCQDKIYQHLFLTHLHEELGHDQLLAARDIKNQINDPILQAVSSWFCHQMFLLDNLEKTVLVHLVLEVAGIHYHNLAKVKAAMDVKSEYYDVHNEHDDKHAEMAFELLQDHTPATYQRLLKILSEGWDMLNAMNCRVAQLIDQVN